MNNDGAADARLVNLTSPSDPEYGGVFPRIKYQILQKNFMISWPKGTALEAPLVLLR